jgi:signal transduction histidine kinase
MTDTDREVSLHGRSYAELQQWIHDLRTPLSIISMGVDALQRVRHDDQQFKELSEMIAREGIGPLNRLLDELGNENTAKTN